jgi:hypothetical protein
VGVLDTRVFLPFVYLRGQSPLLRVPPLISDELRVPTSRGRSSLCRSTTSLPFPLGIKPSPYYGSVPKRRIQFCNRKQEVPWLPLVSKLLPIDRNNIFFFMLLFLFTSTEGFVVCETRPQQSW